MMNTPKYNWEQLSAEYLEMSHQNNQLTLKLFCEQKGIPYNTASKKMRSARQGAPLGSQRARKHGGYAQIIINTFGEDAYNAIANATLEDDLLVLRATLSNTLDVLTGAQEFFNSLTSWEEKKKMLEPLLSIHAALDRKIQRIESVSMTVCKLKLEDDQEYKRKMELERLSLMIKKIRNEIEFQIVTKGSGKLTPLEKICADIQSMENDGFVNCQ